jgi:23S rRNA (cytidine1920-2'-O)/16S rRNA (cytidine1409-2'-O)-methyltransferase
MAEAKQKKRKTDRADSLLVSQGLAETRNQARALLLAGEVFIGTQRVEKPGSQVATGAQLRVRGRSPFVGRGGVKLSSALAAFNLNVTDLTALDVGASTGGFTDCLLQRGTRHVYAVDVGYGQLAERLRSNPRVTVMERVNAREPFALPGRVGLLVSDVSFISLRLVLPPSLEHLSPGGYALVLVKPQFEVGKGQVAKGGVVRDPMIHAQVVGSFCVWAISQGLRFLGVRPSPIEGDKGNREFFVLLQKLEV